MQAFSLDWTKRGKSSGTYGCLLGAKTHNQDHEITFFKTIAFICVHVATGVLYITRFIHLYLYVIIFQTGT